MYWFNLAALERQMVDDRYTEKNAFNYFLAYFILIALTYWVDTEIDGLFRLIIIPNVIITIWGSYAIFNNYKKHNGTDFFSRYWGLSWVISFRLLLLFIPLAIILGSLSLFTISNYFIDTPYTPNFNWFELASHLLLTGIYYWLLKRSLKRVATKQPLK